MKLVIDIGNSNICFGTYEHNHLHKFHRIETKSDLKSLKDSLKNLEFYQEITSIILSSVVPELQTPLNQVLLDLFPNLVPSWIDYKSIPLTLAVDAPAQVGTDRLINAYAAYDRYKSDSIIVDLGTATKFDVVSASGTFEGGIICPGLLLSQEALYNKASKLNPVPIAAPQNLVGKNTKDCLQSGIYYGYAGMIDHLVTRIKKQLNRDFLVLATGGLSPILIEALDCLDHHHEDLTLYGLNKLPNAK